MQTLDQRLTDFRERAYRDWAGDETAAAWQKYFPQLKQQLGPVTTALVEAADPQPGMRVLDLASGNGEPSISLAQRVAPAGSVTATDFSPGMLAALEQNAEAAGVWNIQTQDCDAHELPFGDYSFDLVTSRFGVMFFAEVGRALAGVRRVLKPGGKVAFMVWGPPLPGSYFGAVALPYMARLPERPDPDGPGPMRFAEPGKLAKHLESAGFDRIEETSQNLPAPFPGSPQDLLVCMMDLAAPFRSAAMSLSDADREAAEREVMQNLGDLYDGKHTNVTAPVRIVTAVSS